ncbi:MAG: FAD-dependent oxidoreductase [Pirellulaceae bacterium]
MPQSNHDNTPVKNEFTCPVHDLPQQARAIIVGGGIAGASVAYHLAQLGWTDIHLLEQSRLSSGTTWHSAGQVGQLRSSQSQTLVNKASAALYAQLQQATGHDPGWVQCGGLQLAASAERLRQLKRNAAMARVFQVDADIISPAECANYWPQLRTDDLHGGVYLPGDGRVLPGECTVALAQGAMQRGVVCHEQTEVLEILWTQSKHGRKRITGVRTNRGTVHADWVVLATNMWLRQMGQQIGVPIPVYACEHHYVITQPIDGVDRHQPCTRDPDAGIYFRSLDDGGMKLGAFKRRSKPWELGDHVPSDFAFSLLPEDWPDFAEPFQSMCHRLGFLDQSKVVKFINGPEAFTPDNNFIMGRPAFTDGLFVLGGFNSAGIACAGGAGLYSAEWMDHGDMTIDLSSVDVRRFMPFQSGKQYLRERVSEVLGLHYQMAWPNRQMETARNIRASALYDRHRQHNACFGESAGWERPLWYAPVGECNQTEYSFGQQNWQQWTNAEVTHCRQYCGLLDQSTFGKLRVTGPDATVELRRLCANDIDVPAGTSVYTAMLNERGTFESDLTVVRIGLHEYYLVTATAQAVRDRDWLLGNFTASADVTVEDVSEQCNVIGVMGPDSRRLLQCLTDIDLSHNAFAFGQSKSVEIGSHQVRATRISYVGELGWELHCPVTQVGFLWDRLWEAGVRELGEDRIRPVGNNAISAMRIEKAYRAWGHDISADETPWQAGLGFAIDWNHDFLGKQALEDAKSNGYLTKRLVSLTLADPNIILWGGEPILRDGSVVGYTTSAAYGPSLGCSVAMGYVRNPDRTRLDIAKLSDGQFAILCEDRVCEAHVTLRSPFDPGRKKVLC